MKYKFKKGQRVRPSAQGIASYVFTKTHVDQSGVIVKVDEFGCPTILWDGRKTPKSYHYDFITPDRRRFREDKP